MATVDKSYVIPLSTIKMEFVELSDVDDAESFVSLLSKPEFGVAFVADRTAIGFAPTINLSISGKTITLNNSGLSSSSMLALVFGF